MTPADNAASGFEVIREHVIHQWRKWRGRLYGHTHCPRCGWSLFAPAPYSREPHDLSYSDYAGCHVLCESCNAALAPAQRLPYYEQLMKEWERQGPIYNGVHARDLAKLVREAVMAGG